MSLTPLHLSGDGLLCLPRTARVRERLRGTKRFGLPCRPCRVQRFRKSSTPSGADWPRTDYEKRLPHGRASQELVFSQVTQQSFNSAIIRVIPQGSLLSLSPDFACPFWVLKQVLDFCRAFCQI